MLDLVGNPEDRFSRDVSQLNYFILTVCRIHSHLLDTFTEIPVFVNFKLVINLHIQVFQSVKVEIWCCNV